jgi:ribose 5-phosphate isomerase A
VRALGCDPVLRLHNDQPYLTDSGNYILDCHFPPISEAAVLAAAIKAVVGVVEHGLFLGMAGRVVIAGQQGVYELERP